MESPPDFPAGIAALNAAVDRFCKLPLPDGGPALATFLPAVQRASDRLAVKFSEAAAAFALTDEFESDIAGFTG